MELSILELFLNASIVVKSVIIILILASIISWMIIFERWIYIKRADTIGCLNANFVIKLATKKNSLAHYAKGTLSFENFNRLTTTNFKSFTPIKSFFHLSLTVLLFYRLSKIFRVERGSPKF